MGAQLTGICLGTGVQAERQHGARVARVDHAVVQHQAAGVERIGLGLEHADDLVELRLADAGGRA
jgi:hypothetical protein